MINLFTKLTYIFALLAIFEFIIGIIAENYFSNYYGSFFQQKLPLLFVITLSASIFCNILISVISYVKR